MNQAAHQPLTKHTSAYTRSAINFFPAAIHQQQPVAIPSRFPLPHKLLPVGPPCRAACIAKAASAQRSAAQHAGRKAWRNAAQRSAACQLSRWSRCP